MYCITYVRAWVWVIIGMGACSKYQCERHSHQWQLYAQQWRQTGV